MKVVQFYISLISSFHVHRLAVSIIYVCIVDKYTTCEIILMLGEHRYCPAYDMTVIY